MSEPFVGQIMPFPFSFPPIGWLECNGQTLPIGQYQALYAVLGTKYGGNGTTNFSLPNLLGRVGVGQGKSPVGGSTYIMGEPGGASTVTLTVATILPHTHTFTASTTNGASNTPAGHIFGSPFATTGGGKSGSATTDEGVIYNNTPPNTTLTAASVVPSGGNTPHNNMQPYVALRYCIATVGVFPTKP